MIKLACEIFKKMLCIPSILLSCFSLNAQSFNVGFLNALAEMSVNDQQAQLKEKGFAKMYGGPKKMGGLLMLFHQKTRHELLFIHADDLGNIEQFNYYLPTRIAYQNAQKPQNNLEKGVDYRQQGLVEYEGKKYYHLIVPVRKIQNKENR